MRSSMLFPSVFAYPTSASACSTMRSRKLRRLLLSTKTAGIYYLPLLLYRPVEWRVGCSHSLYSICRTTSCSCFKCTTDDVLDAVIIALIVLLLAMFASNVCLQCHQRLVLIYNLHAETRPEKASTHSRRVTDTIIAPSNPSRRQDCLCQSIAR